jgi:hypothetical protein
MYFIQTGNAIVWDFPRRYIYSEIPILLSCDLNTEYFILRVLKFNFINQRQLMGKKYRNVTIVCQINILVGVQALAWFCQTKVWTPFSESLYNENGL